MNSDTPSRISWLVIVSGLPVYYRRKFHLKKDPGSTAFVLKESVATLAESVLNVGVVVFSVNVPNPLPSGRNWERLASEKYTVSLFHG